MNLSIQNGEIFKGFVFIGESEPAFIITNYLPAKR